MNNNLWNDTVALARQVAREENLRVTLVQAARGGIIAGAGAAIGGLLLGPIGIFAGAVLGGGIAMGTSESFRPLHQVIAEMPESSKRRLVRRIEDFMANRNIADVVVLGAMLVEGANLREVFIVELINFATQELGQRVLRN